MKFWISLAVGVGLLTVLGTVMVVLNPGMTAPPSTELEVAPPSGPQPRAIAEETTRRFENIAQGSKDETLFEIENAGDGDLHLAPSYPDCRCASLVVSRKSPAEGSEDFIKLVSDDKKRWNTERSPKNPGYVTVPPGGKAELVVGWDTDKRLGQYAVQATLRTNDSSRTAITFKVELDVKKDVMIYKENYVDFGVLEQGEKAEQSFVLYSPIHDNMEITELTASTAAFSTETREIPEDLIESLAAKSGKVVVVQTDGTLPEGHFRHQLTYRTSLNPEASDTIALSGSVKGKMELLPSVVDFKVAPGGKSHEVSLKIFAHGLEKDRKLKIGELTPEFLSATIEQSTDFPTLWTVKVKLPPEAPVGVFEGNLSLADDQGVSRVNIPTRGVVADPSGSVTKR